MTNYKYFYITDIKPVFDSMGVTQDEYPFTNGKEYLLEDGKLYGQDPRYCNDNERILTTYELPNWFDNNKLEEHKDKVIDDMLDWTGLIARQYGIITEGCNIVLFTEEELEDMKTNPKYVRTVGLMNVWFIPIHNTFGEECVVVSASNANDACRIAWEKLNTEFDEDYSDFWGCELDWNYTIHKYPNEVLNIWDTTLFYAPSTAEAFGEVA